MSWAAAVAKARSSLNMPPAESGRLWGRGASQITPRLYLSDLWTACDAEKMEKLGITHIVSVIEHRPALPDCVPINRRLQVFLADRSDANILVHLAECTKFITEALEEDENNKVLVHCQQGISRSATVVCAYLCASQGMEAVDAIEYVQSKRSIVCPNAGFRLQLVQYSRPFVQSMRKPRQVAVSNDIASRIKSLFPDKVIKVKPPTSPTASTPTTPTSPTTKNKGATTIVAAKEVVVVAASTAGPS